MGNSPSSSGFNLAHYCLHQSAGQHPDKIALSFIDDIAAPPLELSYSQVENAALCFSGWLLQEGFLKGDRVFIRLKTSPEFVTVFFGALVAGLVPIPLSPLLTAQELRKFDKLVQPRLSLVEDRGDLGDDWSGISGHILSKDDLREILQLELKGVYSKTGPDDPAFMVFTSGSSATPKIVAHGHRVILGRQPMFAGWSDIGVSDRVLHAGALNWTYSLGIGLLDALRASATAVFYRGETPPDIWPLVIDKSEATIFAAVPSLYRRLLKYGDPAIISHSALRHALCAGEPLSKTLYSEWLSQTGRPLYESLGMSEISTYISSSPRVPVKPGSPGKPQKGRKVAILSQDMAENEGLVKKMPIGESGVIAVHKSDPGLFLGYFSNGTILPPAFVDGWFVTGDQGRLDMDGYIWFEGRSDEIMNPSGYRVSPLEIEEALIKARSCSEIAICEVEVAEDVRVICAFIVPVEGASKQTVLDEIRLLSNELASYKRPREFIFVTELARTANGKLKRAEIVRSHFKAGS